MLIDLLTVTMSVLLILFGVVLFWVLLIPCIFLGMRYVTWIADKVGM